MQEMCCKMCQQKQQSRTTDSVLVELLLFLDVFFYRYFQVAEPEMVYF